MKKEVTRALIRFIDVAFVCGILIGAILVYVSSRKSIFKTKTWERYSPLTTFISSLGLILLVYNLIVTDWEGAMFGAFYFLAFFPPSALLKHIMLQIFHRVCLLVLGVLGYYMFGLSLLGILLLILGIVGLVDMIYIIIRRKPLSLKPPPWQRSVR